MKQEPKIKVYSEEKKKVKLVQFADDFHNYLEYFEMTSARSLHKDNIEMSQRIYITDCYHCC